jgi:hypothetical protein
LDRSTRDEHLKVEIERVWEKPGRKVYRARKALGWKTPAEALNDHLAARRYQAADGLADWGCRHGA